MTSGQLTPATQGAARRRFLRRFLGKPEGIRRWIAGSIPWMALAVLVFLVTSNVYLMVLMALADIAAFVGRYTLVGDEDEFNASLNRTLVRAVREGVPAEEPSDPNPDAWFARSLGRFDDAPPPPVAQDADAEAAAEPPG